MPEILKQKPREIETFLQNLPGLHELTLENNQDDVDLGVRLDSHEDQWLLKPLFNVGAAGGLAQLQTFQLRLRAPRLPPEVCAKLRSVLPCLRNIEVIEQAFPEFDDLPPLIEL